jgi:hypothetical protein
MRAAVVLILRAVQERHPACGDSMMAMQWKSQSTKVEDWGQPQSLTYLLFHLSSLSFTF